MLENAVPPRYRPPEFMRLTGNCGYFYSQGPGVKASCLQLSQLTWWKGLEAQGCA